MGMNADGTWTPDGPLGIGYGQPVKANAGLNPNAQFQLGATTDADTVAALAGTQSLVINNGTGGLAEQGWTDKVAKWFTPQGNKGTSVGGNITNAIGTGVGAATGLAGMYFAKKNYDLQKDNQAYLKNREAQSDVRKNTFANNAGNGASYL